MQRCGLRTCIRSDTIIDMFIVQKTDEFAQWLDGLKDAVTRARLIRRLQRAEAGNLGDVKPLGQGVFEMREFFGPGWRMYYVKRGERLIVMLGGGGKPTQARDIETARKLAARITTEG